jgi:citronellol/citronellal dehydrogenase
MARAGSGAAPRPAAIRRGRVARPNGVARSQRRADPRAMTSLQGKTLFVTGASRGIGKAIALRAARDGANVVVAAKSSVPNPKLPGTIHTTAAEIEAAGGQALAAACDVRDEESVKAAVARAVERFGGIDVLVNNASAIWLAGILETPMKRFDLMSQVNVRGTFLCTQVCIPHLAKAENPHVLVLAPPPSLEPRWFAPHLGYTLAKMGMSFCVLGLSEELRERGIAVNALWPKTIVSTAALNLLGGEETARHGRKPEIVADAAHAILTMPARETTGQFFIDEEVLRERGVGDFEPYAVEPGQELWPDLFLDPDGAGE